MSLVRFERATLLALLSGFVFSVAGMAQLMPAPPQVPQIPQGPPMPSMPTMPDSQVPQGPPPDMPQQRQQQQDQERRNNQQGSAGFLGAWCAQGDPSKQASISSNGPMLNLTNESGSTSIGNMQGNNQIVAPEWQFVTGTLSGDGRRINWSNGTFWARCYGGGGGGGGGYRTPNLNGNWYPNGNRSLQCSIQQRRGNLTLQNEVGDRATGSFNGKWSVTTNWQGTRITGTISRDGTRIDWSNGTYWIRYRLYGQ
ncbi:hypothetical protein [Tunturiibacter gelidoferens]|uniref:Uncharacterized protein n=1 Tax=Tunturiibacter gelidiferens TaxID=3069689 RepID=A0A9X0QIH8_9BACT|nr:hypothetical protein [Edaphobacter lichenicola]MBB5330965.1 hypothetical protein [Edaphobacter lichenicola]